MRRRAFLQLVLAVPALHPPDARTAAQPRWRTFDVRVRMDVTGAGD